MAFTHTTVVEPELIMGRSVGVYGFLVLTYDLLFYELFSFGKLLLFGWGTPFLVTSCLMMVVVT